MSNEASTPVATSTPAVSEPTSPTGLTGAPAAVYTALVASPGTTAADIALAAGVGRSTAGKALAALEHQGLVTRTPGDQRNGRRLPDRWHPTQPPAATGSESEIAVAASAHSPHPASDAACAPDSAADPIAPEQPHAEDAASSTAAEHEAADTGPDEATDIQEGQQPPNAEPAPVQDTAAAVPVPHSPNGQKTRLAPGALRRMVIDHLTAHPSEAFTATRISRAIDKSSGAIANCLVTLLGQGVAEQTSEKPRTYRLAAAEATGTE